MIDGRYKKLTGMHAGHIYKVKAPASEMDSPMRWSLQNEAKADDRLGDRHGAFDGHGIWHEPFRAGELSRKFTLAVLGGFD